MVHLFMRDRYYKRTLLDHRPVLWKEWRKYNSSRVPIRENISIFQISRSNRAHVTELGMRKLGTKYFCSHVDFPRLNEEYVILARFDAIKTFERLRSPHGLSFFGALITRGKACTFNRVFQSGFCRYPNSIIIFLRFLASFLFRFQKWSPCTDVYEGSSEFHEFPHPFYFRMTDCHVTIEG